MTARASQISNDVHLHPLYLKLAADSFSNGKLSEGMTLFGSVCSNPKTFEHKVYKQMWKLKVHPDGSRERKDPEYGRKCFHGPSSSVLEKAQAIEMSLRKIDRNELQIQENGIHGCLWRVKGHPPGDLEYGKHAFNGLHGRHATFEEKLSAIRMYASQSRALTWISENNEVRLIRSGNALKYTGIDNGTGRIWSGPVDCGGRPVESVISLLSTRDMTLNGDIPSFPRFAECEEWSGSTHVGTKEVKLLWKGDQLIWHSFDRSTKTSSWAPAGNDAVYILESLSELPSESRKPFLMDFNIATSFDNITGKILSASISKVRKESKLGPSQTIDRDNWAVTLISDGESSDFFGFEVDRNCGHAKIIYEGIESGARFIGFVHVTAGIASSGYATVIAKGLDVARDVEYRKKTPTWLRPRALVEGLIRENGKIVPFNHSGNPILSDNTPVNLTNGFVEGFVGTLCEGLASRREVFSFENVWGGVKGAVAKLAANPDYNCLTWAKERLELMGIVI